MSDSTVIVNTLEELTKILGSNVYKTLPDHFKVAFVDAVMFKACISIDHEVDVAKDKCYKIISTGGFGTIFDNSFVSEIGNSTEISELIVQICLSLRNRLIVNQLVTNKVFTVCYMRTFKSGNSLINIL